MKESTDSIWLINWVVGGRASIDQLSALGIELIETSDQLWLGWGGGFQPVKSGGLPPV